MKEVIETSKGKFIITDNLDDINNWINNGKYEYICQVNRVEEKSAREIVKMTWINDNIKFCKYKNYVQNGKGSFSSAIQSLHSLFELKGIEITNNTYIFKK